MIQPLKQTYTRQETDFRHNQPIYYITTLIFYWLLLIYIYLQIVLIKLNVKYFVLKTGCINKFVILNTQF